ncbi:MAG: hypothetical protein AAF266_03105 [Planctomycetota bacterium]
MTSASSRVASMAFFSVITVIFCQDACGVQVYPSARPTIDLSGSGNGVNLGSIAYHPGFGLYYGSHIGSRDYSAHVWNAQGTEVQTISRLGIDVRSLNFNPGTGDVEVISFDALNSGGLYTLGLDEAGRMTGTNPLVRGPLSGLNGRQTMPAYNAASDVFYSRGLGETVHIVNRRDGQLAGTIQLDLNAAGGGSLQSQTVGFDPVHGALITVDTANERALVHDLNGTFLGASALPTGLPLELSYNMGYANGQLFVTTAERSFTYRGFQILVPEPTAAGIVAIATMTLLSRCRRQWSTRAA